MSISIIGIFTAEVKLRNDQEILRVRQDAIPLDHDVVINRNNDVTFSDRTEREQEAFLLISHYVDLARGLINIAKNHEAKENIINDLLNSKTMNHGLAMKPRKYSGS